MGVAHCRCVSSCTAALILSMHVLGIGAGDEVLVPAMTFVASANAVEHAGATPVLVDSVPGTGLIDLEPPKRRSPPARGRSCPSTWPAARSTWIGWPSCETATVCT